MTFESNSLCCEELGTTAATRGNCRLDEFRINMSKKTQFTWEELSSLNKEHNAHVAVRGKVIYLEIFHFMSRPS